MSIDCEFDELPSAGDDATIGTPEGGATGAPPAAPLGGLPLPPPPPPLPPPPLGCGPPEGLAPGHVGWAAAPAGLPAGWPP